MSVGTSEGTGPTELLLRLRAWVSFSGRPYWNVTEELCFIETSHLTLSKRYRVSWLSTINVSVITVALPLGPSQYQSGRAHFRISGWLKGNPGKPIASINTYLKIFLSASLKFLPSQWSTSRLKQQSFSSDTSFLWSVREWKFCYCSVNPLGILRKTSIKFTIS